MSRGNQKNERHIKSTAATIAIGAAVGYGAYKLFESFFGSNEPHANQPKGEGVPKSIPFEIIAPHRFPKDLKIYVVETVEECQYAMRELQSHCDEFGVLGFDCEWVTKQAIGRQKVALVQLASHRGLCVLVRLSKLKHIPSDLKEILVDRSIIKVGVGSSIDARYLLQDYLRPTEYESSDGPMIQMIQSTLELGRMANMANCDGSNGGYKRSLGAMSEQYLGVTLDKDVSICCSNWEADILSDDQITYAAKDALVGIELFKFFGDQIEPNSMSGRNPSRRQKVIDACFEHLDLD